MMRFKIKTTAGAALAVATVAAFISIVFGVVLALQPTSILICSCGLFVLLFFAAHYLFNLFVRYRIKPIYQVLLSKNIRTHDLPPTHDLVSGLQDELNLWAEKNAREIARLKENERYRKEFLGNVSHEIKTPIFTIQGYILTLLDGGLEDENINRKYLERSEKSIDRLINIVQDLEEISKLESGSLVLEPERFDIVIFKYPDDESQLFIKRVIGLPGETVEIKDGKVYIDGSETPLDDSFIPETMKGSFGPYQVPEDCYFMLGDNRNNSKDSRYWKNTYVRFDQIVGKAVIRYYPSIKLVQ